MSSFAGVSIVADGKLFTTSAIDVATDSGYLLLLVQGYSRTKEDIPNGGSIDSHPFRVGGHCWFIEYSPNGDNPSCADFISLYLYLVIDEDEPLPVEARYRFSFVEQVEEQNPMNIRATEICSFSEDGVWGRIRFMRRDALERSSYLRGDCFTVRCDIVVCKDTNIEDAARTMPDIGHHFYNLRQNKLGVDVTFDMSGETFDAHRGVLAARSTVFMAQLFGPMKEGTTSGIIQIKDMKAEVFRAMLSYIYTGLFPDMEEDKADIVEQGQEEEEVEFVMWLQDLLVAADRYDLQRLKVLCEEQLSVASTLALAERHYCHGLKEACLKYIQVQLPPCSEQIMATDAWEDIRTNYPSLMNEFTAKLTVQVLN